MGLFDKIRGEFIDVIEWVDDGAETLVHRFPTYNREIQMGSTLVVRESQQAVFVYRGQIADVYGPGDYKLVTDNMPVMTTLQHWTTGFNAPFKAEVYYFNTRQFTDLKWGTPNPITLRDAEFGVLRLRAFGNYSMRVADPEKVMKELSGTAERFGVEDVSAQLRSAIITRFTDFIGESQIPFLDYAANLHNFSEALTEPMREEFAHFGLALEKFFIMNVSLPPEVEKVLDQRSSMAAVGDMDAYTKYQVASSMPEAMKAGGDGGLAGAGVGAGLGLAVGQTLAGALGQQPGPPAQAAAPAPSAGGAPAAQKIMVRCPKCSNLSEETDRFCRHCGNQLIQD